MPTTPQTRVMHHPAGWTLPALSPHTQDCTTNHTGQLPCTDTAVWKVVEDHGPHLTISFWCNTDLPAKHRHHTA